MAAIRSLERWTLLIGERRGTRRWPMRRFSIAVMMLVILCTVGVAAVLSANIVFQPAAPLNPFADYETIMPGQFLSALDDYGCPLSFYSSEYYTLSEIFFYCEIQPETEHILSVRVNGADNRIFGLSFQVKDLKVGDLVRLWGNPDQIRTYKTREAYAMLWNRGIYATATRGHEFSYWSDVHMVMIMNATSDD